jgi:hypothetical protein
MAWDKSLPNNGTKIRNYPTVLTSNFAAVEEGGTTLQFWKQNFIERNAIPSAPAVDPARIDDVMQVYSKQNADGETDLYVTDDRAIANVIELTENGKVGGRAQSFVMQDVSFGTKTDLYTEDNMVTAWAYVNSAGALQDGTGLTSVKNSTGKYTISFSTSASNATYGVLLTSLHTPGNPRVGHYNTLTVNDFDVAFVNASGTHTNTDFTVMVIGGR